MKQENSEIGKKVLTGGLDHSSSPQTPHSMDYHNKMFC